MKKLIIGMWLLCVTAVVQASFVGLGDVVENPDGSYLLKTSDVDEGEALTSASVFELETFLGLSAGAIDSPDSNEAFDGSAIKMTLELTAGDVISYSWFWQTDEMPELYDGQVGLVNDFAFASLSGDGGDGIVVLVDAESASFAGKYELFLVPYTGVFTFGFGVVNVEDSAVLSAFEISDFSHTAVVTSPVPVPASLLLFVSALSLAGVVRRGQRH